MKIAVTGAGSVGFTRKLMRDIPAVPEFSDAEFASHDSNSENLSMIAQGIARCLSTIALSGREAASVLPAFTWLQRFLVQGLTAGAVKG